MVPEVFTEASVWKTAFSSVRKFISVCGAFLTLLCLAFLLGRLFGKCSTKVNTAGTSVGVQWNLAERVVVPRSQRSMLSERIAVCPSFGTAYHALTCGYIQRASVTKEYSPCAICLGGATVSNSASSSSTTRGVPEPLHDMKIQPAREPMNLSEEESNTTGG